MKTAGKFQIVLVTAPDLKTARRLARGAVVARLIACTNLIPNIESHYRWQGKIECGREVLLIMKTTRSRLGALEKYILAQHPYTTPEFIVLPVAGGAKGYLDWLANSCRSAEHFPD
jgi:periplasmic divalent cation tolerance protein